MQLRDYQELAIEAVRDSYRAGHRRTLLVSPTGSGKCYGKGTPILMYNGSIKSVEDIAVGDLLMGPDSLPRRVESLARGREEMVRITHVKGDPFECNRSHILCLDITPAKKGEQPKKITMSVMNISGRAITSSTVQSCGVLVLSLQVNQKTASFLHIRWGFG